MLQISGLYLDLPGGRRLFDGITWQIATGDRVALVGANGVGKTTLFRSIVGQIQCDSGTIQISPSGATLGYLAQDLSELPDQNLLNYLKAQAGLASVEGQLRSLEARMVKNNQDEDLLKVYSKVQTEYEQLGGYAFEATAAKTLRGLGFQPDDQRRNCLHFSGGWKMRIALAALLLRRPDVLLLDEPTNHLDTESMEWLESWLSSYDGTLIAISHDRVFMDKIVRNVAHLENGKLTFYRGNFSSYLAAHEVKIEALSRQAQRQKTERAHLQSFVDKFRYKASKAAQAQSRLRRLEKMDIVNVPERKRQVSMRFPDCRPSGRCVVKAEKLSKAYDRLIFSEVSFELLRNEKIALVGVNGAGKSTLSKIVAAVEEPTEGKVLIGHGVQMAYFSQESSENLNYHKTLWEEIQPLAPHWSEGEKRGLLGCFLFDDDDLQKSVDVLSGGEKSRLALAKILLQPSNFLVLDEPTNHLDMATRELFQQALLSYQGTLLIVSHDRYFLNQLVDRVLEIREGQLYDYQGNYSWFIETRARQLEREEAESVPQAKTSLTPKDRKREKRREEGERRNEIYRKKKKYLDELVQTEEAISADEILQNKLEKALCDPEVLENAQKLQDTMIAHAEVAGRLKKNMKQWETLMETIGTIEAGLDGPREGERS